MSEQFLTQERTVDSDVGEELRQRRRIRSYLAAFVAGIILSVASFYAALGVLRAMDRLPPPPVSATWCIDSRLTWLRDNPDWKNAGLLAVGSSATLHNLDFGVIPSEAQARGVVNAAPCFLTVNQTRYLTEFLVQRASKPDTVMTVLAPRDFQGCSRYPTAFFDPDLLDQFMDRQVNKAWLRFRNFRLKDVFFHAIYADERRSSLQYDQFGSAPLTSEVPHTGHAFAPESPCYSELTRLATLLESRGIQFTVVTFPVMQGWAERYDQSGAVRARFKSAVESALAPTKAILVDGMTGWHAPDSAFTDPVHLQWPETAAFTRFVWKEARRQGADLPPLEEEEAHNSVLDDSVLDDAVLDDARESPGTEFTSSKEITITSPILDPINQNTPGQSEGYAVGVPRTYAWCSGSYKPPGTSAPPSNFTAVTGWGQVYPKVGAPAYSNPDGSIMVANAKTYVHLNTTREWVLVQDQAAHEISGAHFVSDFKRGLALPMKLSAQPDGSVVIGIPPTGYNDHFWIINRGTYAAGGVDGVYVQMDMRTNDPNMKFVANVGADWWRDATADYVQGFGNNPGAGMSNWVELSTQWSTLRFYSWSTSKLLTDPPPPLAETKPAPVLVRRLASTSPPCLSAPKARPSN
jgi:hypothetical protein